jgi:hypothetical protein
MTANQKCSYYCSSFYLISGSSTALAFTPNDVSGCQCYSAAVSAQTSSKLLFSNGATAPIACSAADPYTASINYGACTFDYTLNGVTCEKMRISSASTVFHSAAVAAVSLAIMAVMLVL